MKVEELSLEEKIGQLFMFGRKREEIEGLEELINKYKIGGIILYRRNYETYEEMLKLINNIKTMNSVNKVPMFISIDQEGGRVNRMPDEILNIPTATKLANTKEIDVVRRSGKIIGEMLYKTGISMNYGPIFDIRRFNENHPIGDRCFGTNKEEVQKYAIEVMKELQEQGVIPVIKHFPGHGLTSKDSHFQFPIIEEKIENVENEDMAVFKSAIEANADAVMVGHLMLKEIDSKYPASLSKKIIQDYLIEKYNFKGLIITDDMKMWAIRVHYNMKKAVEKAIEAGNDIVMVGLSYKEVEGLIKYITKKVKNGKISEERINRSVEKILNMKEKYNITDKEVKGFDIEEMNEQIKNVREKVLK